MVKWLTYKIDIDDIYICCVVDLDSGSGVRFYSPAASGDTVSLSQACSRSDSRTAGEYELLIKQGRC
jgi:hypothetical protein